MRATRSKTVAVALGVALRSHSEHKSGPAGEQRYGEAIDPKAPKVTLSELLTKPDNYTGKDAFVEGNFGDKCCGQTF